MEEMRIRVENRAYANILIKALPEIECDIVDDRGEIFIVTSRDIFTYSSGEQSLLMAAQSLSIFSDIFKKLDANNKKCLSATMISLAKYLQEAEK